MRVIKIRLLLLIATAVVLPSALLADDKVIRIYQDADLSSNIESSEAIQKGIEVAFGEVNNEVSGYKVEFKYLDHRGNVVRSKRNYKTFLADSKALAIYSGIHSPPLIKNRAFINENKALTLVPWAAGSPITRYPAEENWVFRLSVDDLRAGGVIIDFAMKDKNCKSPMLFLESTPWGDSNLKSMSLALAKHNILVPDITRFGWNLKHVAAKRMLRKAIARGGDCLVLVGNAVEGAVLVQAMVDLPKEDRLPVVSHWGITGGNFHDVIPAEQRKELSLHFIQSCFAFTNEQQSDLSVKVFADLVEHADGEIDRTEDLKSAVGFIHGYDLTKLLIAAINQVGLSGDIKKDREMIRLALEDLRTPVQGLVKEYQKPFSVFDAVNNNNAHEALHTENFCMGEYGAKDEILISPHKGL
jgi:branched-chain amino acid transport system substrate-binding protein